MTKAFHFSCEGESHKANNKVCQDYSLTSYADNLIVAIVCDGHGGECYFRSDVGARFAAEVTLESVSLFVDNVDKNLFINQPFTAIGPTSSIEDVEQLPDVDNAFRRLFSSIIYKWNEKIEEHARINELTDWEKANVPQKYLDEYADTASYEKYYGCTLMTYVQTQHFWFAFHIGDGKCLSFQKNPVWKEPIPWDERCFLNRTTSICDTSAIDEFRYCYQGDGEFPIAIFLGSDGIDDTFGEEENLVNFYIQIMKMLASEGQEATEDTIKQELPTLSAVGSKDDMSIASVYNEELLRLHILDFLQYQIQSVQDAINIIDNRIDSLTQKLKDTENEDETNERTKINANYALQDIERAKESRQKLLDNKNTLISQLQVFSHNLQLDE